MIFNLFKYYLDQNFYIDNYIKQVVRAVCYVYIFDFITHFLLIILIHNLF